MEIKAAIPDDSRPRRRGRRRGNREECDKPQAGRPCDPALYAGCRECEYCLSRKANLHDTQGKGVMTDGTSRFSLGGEPLYHYIKPRPSQTTWCCRKSPRPTIVTGAPRTEFVGTFIMKANNDT